MLQRTTRDEQINGFIQYFMTASGNRRSLWKDCFGICTDDAPSIIGFIKGFASLVIQENPDMISTQRC